ncbi:MAG: hypothetical protein CBC35_01470 [Planctomycetes bacterium TMED75]|nr:DNA mismatch repair protein MutT [Planctomycetaceae bacterium]OUU96230.1 MAG: hypothetical protein CBC35_01470 [Planctomycetes bacterium TMED75]
MSSSRTSSPDSLFTGNHLELARVGAWEFVRRTKGAGVVGVAGMTPEREVLLVEQLRPPLGAIVIELPAGLVGDEHEETPLEAARRELLEETGYTAPLSHFEWLMAGPSSSGLTNELVDIVRAKDLVKASAGGGVGDERIRVHLVPLVELNPWIHERIDEGMLIDFKVRLLPHFLSEEV